MATITLPSSRGSTPSGSMASRPWAALSSASTVVPVQDTGHTIQLDQPALVIEEIAMFMEAAP